MSRTPRFKHVGGAPQSPESAPIRALPQPALKRAKLALNDTLDSNSVSTLREHLQEGEELARRRPALSRDIFAHQQQQQAEQAVDVTLQQQTQANSITTTTTTTTTTTETTQTQTQQTDAEAAAAAAATRISTSTAKKVIKKRPHCPIIAGESLNDMMLRVYNLGNRIETEDIDMSGWVEGRKKAFPSINENSNGYFYRYNLPGEEARFGAWDEDELEHLKNRVEWCRPYLERAGKTFFKWGSFAKEIPGRVGYQVLDTITHLIVEGEIEPIEGFTIAPSRLRESSMQSAQDRGLDVSSHRSSESGASKSSKKSKKSKKLKKSTESKKSKHVHSVNGVGGGGLAKSSRKIASSKIQGQENLFDDILFSIEVPVLPVPIAFAHEVRGLDWCAVCSSSSAGISQDLILRCTTCGEMTHSFCLEAKLFLPPSSTPVGASLRKNWQCMRCKVCESCNTSEREEALLVCERCDRAWHTFCCEIEAVPADDSEWVCRECSGCLSCGADTARGSVTGSVNGDARTPLPSLLPATQQADAGSWFTHEFTQCVPCGQLYSEGHYCPVCQRVYSPTTDAPMILCDGCDKWVDIECDGISPEKYAALTEAGESLKYYCPNCRRDPSALCGENLARRNPYFARFLDSALLCASDPRTGDFAQTGTHSLLRLDASLLARHRDKLRALASHLWQVAACEPALPDAVQAVVHSPALRVHRTPSIVCKPFEHNVLADNRQCAFCPIRGDSPEYGRLISFSAKYWSHVLCALFAPDITVSAGNVIVGLLRAKSRASSCQCDYAGCADITTSDLPAHDAFSYARKLGKGAVLSCSVFACKRSFHLPCAVAASASLHVASDVDDSQVPLPPLANLHQYRRVMCAEHTQERIEAREAAEREIEEIETRLTALQSRSAENSTVVRQTVADADDDVKSRCDRFETLVQNLPASRDERVGALVQTIASAAVSLPIALSPLDKRLQSPRHAGLMKKQNEPPSAPVETTVQLDAITTTVPEVTSNDLTSSRGEDLVALRLERERAMKRLAGRRKVNLVPLSNALADISKLASLPRYCANRRLSVFETERVQRSEALSEHERNLSTYWRLGSLTIESIGEVVVEDSACSESARSESTIRFESANRWHGTDWITPAGFRSVRRFFTLPEAEFQELPGTLSDYLCEIGVPGSCPRFRISQLSPSLSTTLVEKYQTDGSEYTTQRIVRSFEGSSLGEAFEKFADELALSGWRRHGGYRGSPDCERAGLLFFGLGEDWVRKMCEALPDIELCLRYRFKFATEKGESERRQEVEMLGVELPKNPSGCARSEPYLGRYSRVRRLAADSSSNVYTPKSVRPHHRQLGAAAAAAPISDPSAQNIQDVKTGSDAPDVLLESNMYRAYLRSGLARRMRIARSPIHNLGVVSSVPLRRGDMIIEYVGDVIRQSVADIRERKYEEAGIGCYMFKINDEEIVDATIRGGLARYINHSCDPNSYTRIIRAEGASKIMIFAARDIPRGSEILYDYKFAEEDDKIPCHCGAARCRGTMN